jgi:hypothetical protein
MNCWTLKLTTWKFGGVTLNCYDSFPTFPSTFLHYSNTRRCGLIYAFLIRTYAYEDDILHHVDGQVNIPHLHVLFQKAFEASTFNFGARKGATYNVHIFAHTLQLRKVNVWNASMRLWDKLDLHCRGQAGCLRRKRTRMRTGPCKIATFQERGT